MTYSDFYSKFMYVCMYIFYCHCRHLECSDVNKYLDTQNSRSSSQQRAASVVISQILVMYCNIVTFLRSVLHLDTTFCFSLLQDGETLDRVVSLLAIDTPYRGTSTNSQMAYCFHFHCFFFPSPRLLIYPDFVVFVLSFIFGLPQE